MARDLRAFTRSSRTDGLAGRIGSLRVRGPEPKPDQAEANQPHQNSDETVAMTEGALEVAPNSGPNRAPTPTGLPTTAGGDEHGEEVVQPAVADAALRPLAAAVAADAPRASSAPKTIPSSLSNSSDGATSSNRPSASAAQAVLPARDTAAVTDPDPSAATGQPGDPTPEPVARRRTRGVIVHLTPEHLTHLKTSAAAENVFYSDIVLDALERFWTEIDHIWAARDRGYGLPPRGRRPTGDLRMQVQLRFAPDTLDVLDRRVAETGAPSRNSLISKLLELDMTHPAYASHPSTAGS
jgi:hypothetical protein